MRSLSAHLRQSGSHGDLPFHPGCPVCRTERLSGSPPGDELLSARSRAGLAAALLATTAMPAAPALAGEADSEQEGAVDDKPAAETDPGFGEGTEDADLPADDGAELPATGDDGEVEQAPLGESYPEDEADSEPGEPTPGPAPPLPPTPAPRPPISIPPPPAAPPKLDTVRKPDRVRPGEDRGRGAEPHPLDAEVPDIGSPAPRHMAPVGEEGPSTAAPTIPEEAAPDQAGAGAAHSSGPVRPPAATSPHTRDRSRTHVVRKGESLWSIARNQIGGDATPAQVARLVNRLWELNRERIGTGEPDLLMVGTELRLP